LAGHQPRFLHRNINRAAAKEQKDFAGVVLVPYYFVVRAEFVRFCKESQMAWKTPKIVEVSVGMEINMYACAARK